MGSGAAHVKGVAFRQLLVWLERERGHSFLDRAVGTLPPDLRAQLDVGREALGTLPSTWYPAPLVHALLDAITRDMAPHERSALAREGARAVMSATLGGTYKTLMSFFVTPQVYARFAGRLWQSYYDSGTFTVVIGEDGTSADCAIEAWTAHHPVACEMNLEAATAIYEAMGLKSVSTERTSCIERGDRCCRFVTRWRG